MPTRFSILKDGTVKDNETELIWQRDVPQKGFSWEAAFKYCTHLSRNGNQVPWKLPTLKELASLITQPRANSNITIDSEAFPGTSAGFFWSSSGTESSAAAVVFDLSKFPAGIGPNKSLGNVRCVRGDLKVKTPESDLSSSYNVVLVPQQ